MKKQHQFAVMAVAGFENVTVKIHYTRFEACISLTLDYSFEEFCIDSAGDGTVEDYKSIQKAIEDMRDEDGSLYDRANLVLERIQE